MLHARRIRWTVREGETYEQYEARMNETKKSELKWYEEHDIEVINKETAYAVKGD